MRTISAPQPPRTMPDLRSGALAVLTIPLFVAACASSDAPTTIDEPGQAVSPIINGTPSTSADGAKFLKAQNDTLKTLQNESLREPDVTDRASSETDWSLELRTRDRQRKLIAKIDAALRRIDEGEYGYCEVTGEPISLARLEARPIATMTIEAQERHERNEKISRDE